MLNFTLEERIKPDKEILELLSKTQYKVVNGAVIAAYVTLAIAALKKIVVPVAKTIVVTFPSWVPHMDEVYQYVKAMT